MAKKIIILLVLILLIVVGCKHLEPAQSESVKGCIDATNEIVSIVRANVPSEYKIEIINRKEFVGASRQELENYIDTWATFDRLTAKKDLELIDSDVVFIAIVKIDYGYVDGLDLSRSLALVCVDNEIMPNTKSSFK